MNNSVARYFTLCFLLVALSIKVSGSNKPIVLTSKNYFEKIEQANTIIVDVWAPWCAPCRKLRPVLESVSKELGIQLGTLNLDVYTNFIKNQLEIKTIPTIIFYKEGVEVARYVGLYTKEEIMILVQQHLE